MDLKTFLEHFDTIAEAPGGIQKLRELILDMAVRGKLVPQNPEDEPASVLLQKVQIRKDFLIKEGKIKKIKESKLAIKQNEIMFSLPQGWCWDSLSKLILQIKRGPSLKCNQEGLGIRYITSGNLLNGKLELDAEIKFLDNFDKIHSCRLYPGDVILNCVNSLERLGKSAVFREKHGDAIVGFNNYALELPKDLVSPDYVHVFFQSPVFKRQLAPLTKEAINQASIATREVNSFILPIPPLAEQKRIVEKVDELMALCDRYEAGKQTRDNRQQKLRESAIAGLMNAETDKDLDAGWAFVRDNWHNLSQQPEDVDGLRKSVLQLAIRGELVPQHPNDEPASDLLKNLKVEKEQLLQEKRFLKSEKLAPIKLEDLSYKIPEEWVLTRIGVVCGSIVPNRDKPKTFSGGFPWVTLSNFDEKSIKLRNNHSGMGLSKEEVVEFNARIIPNRSVLMSCIGRFGLVAVLEQDVVTNQQIHGFVIPNGLYPKYVAYVIKAHTEFLESSATSTTVSYLNKTRCESIPFPLPPLAEQKRIVAKVDELMKLCDQLEESLRLSRQRAESLAASAISHLTI